MRVVEDNFIYTNENREVEDGGSKGRQLRANRAPPPDSNWVHREGHDVIDHDIVED